MQQSEPLRAVGAADLHDVVDALGSRCFGPRMAAYADSVFGGHVCFAYHHELGQMRALAAGHVPPDPTNVLVPNVWRYTRQREWERDACLARGMSSISAHLTDAHFHDHRGIESRRHWPWQIPTPLVDKILLCRSTAEGDFILEFSRWGDCAEFDRPAIQRAVETGRLLITLATLHRRMLVSQRDPATAFGSSSEIEQCLARTTSLTARERQVCALQLIGANGSAIGAELGIEAESVKSYRKRAYLRLGVSSERELLLKFLSLRAAWKGRSHDLGTPSDPWRMPFLLEGTA
ncbi:MAG TPA: LuxR C-terminal-related transcriptional regulator [Rubrivivax sp.]|nr:LuxR C-terminal-related transcriptional regulator [Rubrivivax sp.]